MMPSGLLTLAQERLRLVDFCLVMKCEKEQLCCNGMIKWVNKQSLIISTIANFQVLSFFFFILPVESDGTKYTVDLLIALILTPQSTHDFTYCNLQFNSWKCITISLHGYSIIWIGYSSNKFRKPSDWQAFLESTKDEYKECIIVMFSVRYFHYYYWSVLSFSNFHANCQTNSFLEPAEEKYHMICWISSHRKSNNNNDNDNDTIKFYWISEKEESSATVK